MPHTDQDDSIARQSEVERERRSYWLAAHVYSCRTQEGVIFLDTRRDEYVAIDNVAARALSMLVPGRSSGLVSTQLPPDGQWQSDVLHMANAMEKRGLLTRDRRLGKELASIELPPLEMTRFGWSADTRIGAGHVVKFLVACIGASSSLKWRPLEGIVDRVRSRKSKEGGNADVDIDLVERLVGVFHRLRSFFFTDQDRCLFHALALLNFLASYSQFPTWVIGVKTTPFGAHSWVQHRAVVFDDRPEFVCEYTPILAV